MKDKKDIRKLVMYLIPVIVLVVSGTIGIEETTQLESSLSAIVTGIFGILAALGIYANNDKPQ